MRIAFLALSGIRAHDPAALARLTESLAAAGATGKTLPDALLDYGLVAPGTKAFAAGAAPWARHWAGCR